MGARFLLLVLLLPACRSTPTADGGPSPGWAELELVSRVDGTVQPSRVWFPKELTADRPVLLHLHTWSGGWHQESFVPELVEGCAERGWILAMPNFRGPNRNPEACASERAVGDVLDLVDHLEATWSTGPVYVHGASGGGHMGLILAGRYPERWSGVSSWVPITDLARWHAESRERSSKYWRHLEAVCGGPPGLSAAVDGEYAARSPLTHLPDAAGVPIDLNAGIDDGHDGSVPVGHALRAFNVLAAANHAPAARFDEGAIAALESRTFEGAAVAVPGRLRAVLEERRAGAARITIFQGGHEGDARAALLWFDALRKEDPVSDRPRPAR